MLALIELFKSFDSMTTTNDEGTPSAKVFNIR